MSSRILGQEVRITLIKDGQLIKTIQAIKSLTITIKGEAVKSDYLGRKAPVFDEVSDGVEFKLDNEIDDSDYFDLLTLLIRRKQGDPLQQFKVNLTARFNFRNGVRRLGTIVECAFGDIPLEIPERKQKVRSGLTGSAEGIQFPRGV